MWTRKAAPPNRLAMWPTSRSEEAPRLLRPSWTRRVTSNPDQGPRSERYMSIALADKVRP
jgi:hypothetical protein